MFSQLIFLILVLLIVNLASEVNSSFWIESPLHAFFYGLLLYGAFLVGIAIQTLFVKSIGWRKGINRLHWVINLELIIFLFIYHFLFVSHRVLFSLPIIGSSQAVFSLCSLALYFFGLLLFHYATAHRHRLTQAVYQIRIVLPFILPFLLFAFLVDGVRLIPNEKIKNTLNGEETFLILLSVFFLIGIMIFLPFFIQRIWKCQPIADSILQERLEQLCKKAHFTHAGIHSWEVMNHSLTAAIIGVLPRFRYVMFTPRLLKQLSYEEIEAVLAHEIGHSRYGHLLLYPFIMLGMIVSASFFSLLFSETMNDFLGLQNLLYPSEAWDTLQPILVFIPYALIIAFYIRFFFGFFSRLFERQADLHIFALDLPPKHMIAALDHVAILSGNIHSHPSWHHYSIQQRIDFLVKAIENPLLIKHHHTRVFRNLALFFALLVVSLLCLFFPFKSLSEGTASFSSYLSQKVNFSLQQQVAASYIETYHLDNDQEVVKKALIQGLQKAGGSQIPGIAEFYAAQSLLQSGKLSASATLMSAAWKTFPFNEWNPDILSEFERLSDQILHKMEGPSYQKEKEQLIQEKKKHVL